MNLNFLETHHFFGNRLYMSPSTPEEMQKGITKENGEERKGFGIRSYSPIVGKALSALGFASELKVNNQTFYVNNKSFSKYIIRASEIRADEPKSAFPERMDTSYETHKSNGYKRNLVEVVNDRFKETLSSLSQEKDTITPNDIAIILDGLVKLAKREDNTIRVKGTGKGDT